jgi:hypothetical protein
MAKCKTCWQYDVCEPPKEVEHLGCEFYHKEQPQFDIKCLGIPEAFDELLQRIDEYLDDF